MSPDEQRFLEMLRESVADGSFVRLTLGKYRGADPELRQLRVRLVDLRTGPHLSFLWRYRTRDVTHNHAVEDGVAEVARHLGTEFRSAALCTTARDAHLEYNRRGQPRLAIGRPTSTAPPERTHDRARERAIDVAGSPYLRALGVTDARGKVRAGMGGKVRQIEKFLEVLADSLAGSELMGRTEISVVDMGAGKGYLTFATYDFLKSRLGLAPRVLGVEVRPDLVELGGRVAREVGFGGLAFRAGTIADVDLEGADVLVALHACDTATDDALFRGISAGVPLLLCAPCCHKEVRPQIAPPEVLRPVLRHGILRERHAEIATDALRALLLERSGYRARVFEFVATEHTARNLMIAAARSAAPIDREAIGRQIDALKRFYGIATQRLEALLEGLAPPRG